MIMDFRETFCEALSLACNTMVMFDYFWEFSTVDVFRSDDVERKKWYLGPIGRKVEVGQSEIEEAIRLYKILEIFDQKARGKFEIALERWRESKTSQTYEDTVIDLAIALEALYLSDRDGNSELSFQFRLRASWFLGKGKAHRKRLMDKFKAIYNLRSQAVHSGKISEKIKIRKGEEPIATSEFIPKAQDLCRKSIIKILEDGEFPDWDDLILGEDPSSTN